METAIEKACRLAGGQSELARKITENGKKITPQAVYKWVRSGITPPDRAVLIEQITEGKVTASELCPDFPWPVQKKQKRVA